MVHDRMFAPIATAAAAFKSSPTVANARVHTHNRADDLLFVAELHNV